MEQPPGFVAQEESSKIF